MTDESILAFIDRYITETYVKVFDGEKTAISQFGQPYKVIYDDQQLPVGASDAEIEYLRRVAAGSLIRQIERDRVEMLPEEPLVAIVWRHKPEFETFMPAMVLRARCRYHLMKVEEP